MVKHWKWNVVIRAMVFFSEERYSPSMVNGKKRVGSNSLCEGPITSSIDYQMAKPGPAGRRTNHRRSNQPLQIGKKYIVILYFTKLKGLDHKDFWSIFFQDSESQHLIYCFSYSKWKNKWEPISRIIPLVLFLIWKTLFLFYICMLGGPCVHMCS